MPGQVNPMQPARENTRGQAPRRCLLTLIVTFGLVAGASLTAASAPPQATDPDPDEVDLIYDIAECAANNGGAVPVALIGANGNRAILFQDVGGSVFVAWAMTSEMAIGVNTWVFGIVVKQPGPSPHVGSQTVKKTWEGPTYRSSPCVHVGDFNPGIELEYAVTAGAAGWQSSTSCTVEHHWKARAGGGLGFVLIAKLFLAGGGLHGEVEFGGSKACSDGIIYDSEILIGETGTTVLPNPGDGGGCHCRPIV